MDDKAFIEEGNYPHWPLLPVKRYPPDGGWDHAVVLWPYTTIVWHVQLFQVPKTIDELKKLTKTEYPSIEAMLEAGWVVD